MFLIRITFFLFAMAMGSTLLQAENDPSITAPIPVAHYSSYFYLPGDPRLFERHVLLPVEREEDASIQSTYYLHANAGQIIDDAMAHGWMKGPSRDAYFKELELYKQGRWPCTFITEAGDWKILMHIAYASRWDDSALPWEDRFLGDDGNFLPDKITAKSKASIGGYRFPRFEKLPELNSKQNEFHRHLLEVMRPETTGERTEFKFLFGQQPSLLFLRELFHATRDYDLHRYSYRPTTSEDKEEIKKLNTAFPLNPRTIGFTARQLKIRKQEKDRFVAFLQEKFRSPELQKHVANSGIYTHISGEPLGPEGKTARFTYLEKNLRLPSPLYSFIEGYGIGTPGIRTDIAGTPIHIFDLQILTSLDKVPALMKRPAYYLPEKKAKRTRKFTCANYLSVFEKAYLAF